jgi:hypothetical protein
MATVLARTLGEHQGAWVGRPAAPLDTRRLERHDHRLGARM